MSRPLPDVAANHPVPRQGAIAELQAWHRLVICGRPEQVGVARAFVGQVLGASHPGTERATLLTSELVTNSINHSDSRLDGGTITVTVRPITASTVTASTVTASTVTASTVTASTVTASTGADRIRVEVTDDGGPTAPTLRQDDDLAEAGRGLRLVEAYSLEWDYYQDGTRTVTWFECVAEPLA